MGVLYGDGSMSAGGSSHMDNDITWKPTGRNSVLGLHLNDKLAAEHIRAIQSDLSRHVNYRVLGLYGHDEGFRDLVPLNGDDTLNQVDISVKRSVGLPGGRGFQLFIDKGLHPSLYVIPVSELVDTTKEKVARKLGLLYRMCNLNSKGEKLKK